MRPLGQGNLSETPICSFFGTFKGDFKTIFGGPVQSRYKFSLQGSWRQGFLTFCTSDWLDRWPGYPSEPLESCRSAEYRQQVLYFAQRCIHIILEGSKMAKNGDFGGFLDLTRLVGLVMG